ncbi:MAG: hypothetical protein ACYTFI_27075, partial [Planctomycetota bacterium]
MMYLNILHRCKPNLFEFFRLQQDWAHERGLKTTLMCNLPSMYDPQVVDSMKRDHEEFGDEIGLHLSELNCEAFQEKFRCPMNSFWLYSRADKRAILELVLGK